MNKLLFYILFFISATVFSQQKNTAAKGHAIHIDTARVEPKSFRENFQNDYQSKEFQYKAIVNHNSKWETFKAWLRHWLERLFSFEGKGDSSTFDITLKIIAGLIVLFVIYLIVKSVINKEGQWLFGKSAQRKIGTFDIAEEDIHNIDFASIIQKSKQSKDHRLSIRYYYLWLLKRMSDAAHIEWDIEKTNSDYLYEIKKETLKEDFKYLSYIYDYSWYGEFGVDDALFEKAEKAFVKTINSIHPK